MSDFASIINFFNGIGNVFQGIVNCIPDFLRPVSLAFVVIAAIYLVVGRD